MFQSVWTSWHFLRLLCYGREETEHQRHYVREREDIRLEQWSKERVNRNGRDEGQFVPLKTNDWRVLTAIKLRENESARWWREEIEIQKDREKGNGKRKVKRYRGSYIERKRERKKRKREKEKLIVRNW